MSITYREIVTVESRFHEEDYERLWKIKGLPSTIENPEELVSPLEIQTSEDSPLHSKWITTFRRGSNENEMSLVCTLQTIFNEDIKEIQSHLTSGFRFGAATDIEKHYKVVQPGESITLTWTNNGNEKWDWNKYLDAEGEATVYIKLTLMNDCTPEMMEIKLKHQYVVNARNNVASLLSGGRTEIDLVIVSSDYKEIRCHQEMLKANSPVFKTMLESDFSEAQSGRINVTDVSGVTMELLVQYMYTGRLLDTWRQLEFTLELTHAAGKYQMRTLLEYLDNVLGSVPDDSNWPLVISLMKLARKYSLTKAEAKLSDRIVNRALSIKGADEIVTVFGLD